jgi:hypothetical protein
MRKIFFVFIIGGFLYGCDINLDISSPEVMEYYPGKGENIVNTNSLYVKIVFSEDVVKNSVETAFSLKTESGRIIKGSFVWRNEREFLYYPDIDENILPGTHFDLEIGTAVQDKNGNNMAIPFESFFYYQKDVSIPEVVFSIPYNNQSSNFSIYSNIMIVFSLPMDTNSVKNNFTISPSLEGDLIWTNSNTTVFYCPKTPFKSGELYKVSIGENSCSISNVKMNRGFKLNFIPGVDINVPSIEGIFLDETMALPLTNNQHGCEKTMEGIYVLFNKPIDLISLQGGITFDPMVNFTVFPLTNLTNFYLVKFQSVLIPETNYTVTFSESIKSIHGKTMEREVEQTFFVDGSNSIRPVILNVVGEIEGGFYLLANDIINYFEVTTNWSKASSNMTFIVEFSTGLSKIKEISLYGSKGVGIQLLGLDSQNPGLMGSVETIVRDSVNSNKFVINLGNIGVSNYYKLIFQEEICDENSNFIKPSLQEYYFYIRVTN